MADGQEGRGVRVVRPAGRSSATAQTPGIRREMAVGLETTGTKTLWMGVASTAAGTTSGWHHHGDCETGIYVLRGRARFRIGKREEIVLHQPDEVRRHHEASDGKRDVRASGAQGAPRLGVEEEKEAERGRQDGDEIFGP